MISYTNNPYGNVTLPNGEVVALTQQAYNDNIAAGVAGWRAAGYLSTDNRDVETGPTVQVTWASLGADEAENDANWDTPIAAVHYSRGDLI